MPYGLHAYSTQGIDVHTFKSAQACLEACKLTPTGKRRSAREHGYPLGAYYKSVTWVRECSDGSIAFRLYDTDVVTYEPNGDIVIDNYGTKTTTEFAWKFLPGGFHLSHPPIVTGKHTFR